MKTLFSKFSKRERLFFILTTVVILIIAVYIFIVEPVYKKWDRLGLEFELANSRLLKNTKLLANKESLEKQYERFKEYIQKEGDQEEEMAAVLKEIEATALNCGVKITSIKPKGIKQLIPKEATQRSISSGSRRDTREVSTFGKSYKKFSVELISEATISQFLKFIYELEDSKKLLKVERLVLSVKGTQSDLLKGTFLIRKISL